MTEITGRFAPSPTGSLHLGSLVAALGSWLFARSAGGRWLLRIDDLDTQRIISGMADDIMRTLDLLGLQWDGEPLWQSRRAGAYAESLAALERKGAVYGCGCSRSDIARIATAPHGIAEELVYPGTCRHGIRKNREARSVRVIVPDTEITFVDGIFGRVSQSLPEVCGDFVVKRADGLFAYHLATVVDDADSGVNQVVRGSDLLLSTPRQIFLQTLLGLLPPAYFHLPLVTDPSGAKLSKRENIVSLAGRADLLSSGGALMLQALAFLGQDVTGMDEQAPPSEILAESLCRFRPEAIPSTSGPF
jgi:glutamyl-Q tRNA(Asp) synthetase